MLKKSTIDDIPNRWDTITPAELRSALMDTEMPPLVELDARKPEERGYAGPRERLGSGKVPQIFDNRTQSLSDCLSSIYQKLDHHDTIVLAYPTSKYHLGDVQNTRTVHTHEMKRLHSQSFVLELEEVEKYLSDMGLHVMFLPLVKLTTLGIIDNNNHISPIRFWTPSTPPADAAYLLIDDVVEHGRTTQGMLSYLHTHGIADQNIVGIYATLDRGYRGVLQDQSQREFINSLRANHPNIAERADVILHLIGVENLEALTRAEAIRIGITKDATPESFDQSIKSLLENIKNYPAIPEPTIEYVRDCKNLLEEPCASVSL